jgi:hypothetical protein
LESLLLMVRRPVNPADYRHQIQQAKRPDQSLWQVSSYAGLPE